MADLESNARGAEPEATPRAALGTHVELELVDEEGSVERLSVDIVPDEEADFAQGRLGAGTPLARAILGQAAGSKVPYRMGDVAAVRIERVGPRLSTQAGGETDRRQEIVRRAVARSEMINDMAFALAAGSKWGDYDPSRLAPEPDET
jgi:hypothetical protein